MSEELDALADPSARAAQMNASGYFADVPDFSLVLGGPVYQLFRRAHLSGDALELLYRRVVAVVLITWVPLLILALIPAATVRRSSWRSSRIWRRRRGFSSRCRSSSSPS